MKIFATSQRRKRPAVRRHLGGHPQLAHAAYRTQIRQILRGPRPQAKLTVGAPDDAHEREAERVADEVTRMPAPEPGQTTGVALADSPQVQRMCPECEEELRRRPEEEEPQRRPLAAGPEELPEVTPEVHDRIQRLRGGGQPLPASTRAFFEPRFGYDFSQVRVHHDVGAAVAARGVNAHAFTVGRDIVFNDGQYAPHSPRGMRLLAHEMTHVVQQDRQAPGRIARQELPDASEDRPARVGDPGPFPPPHAAGIPSPETCPPPEEMICPPATSSPSSVTNTLIFPVGKATLLPTQEVEINAVAAAWHAAGGTATVRIDGFASAEAGCDYNWNLSCRRAQAVATVLESPTDGSPGVRNGQIEIFAHGESDEAGPALAANRRATISLPTGRPTPPPGPPASCTFPVSLGSARGCGTGAEMDDFDFPTISAESAARLAAWASVVIGSPFRSLVPAFVCEAEMDLVLIGIGGSAGHAAFSRFAAGTGGTATHGPGSTLGAMALVSGSFLATVAQVQADIEAQLAYQAYGGALDACALSVTPPQTGFDFSDGWALKGVIGGTQGEELFATGFTGSIPLRSYSIDLRFVICDDFGVDESDLYAPGLFAFWVLQHERGSRSIYVPFINELDLPITVSGTF